MTLTFNEARAKSERGAYPTIVVGESYPFYAEMVQEYEPPEDRMRNYTGQLVKVLSVNRESDWFPPYIENGVRIEPEVSKSFNVKASDGFEFVAMEEELNGWDYDLGQFYWPDATYGHNHSARYLRDK